MVPKVARPFIYALLSLIALSAIFEWEPWPVSSFRLFSHVRHAEQTSWEVTAASKGESVPFYPDSMSHGLKNFSFRMYEFEHGEKPRQDELCKVWLSFAPEVDGRPADRLLIWKRSWDLSERSGDRALPGQTELNYVCDQSGLKWKAAE